MLQIIVEGECECSIKFKMSFVGIPSNFHNLKIIERIIRLRKIQFFVVFDDKMFNKDIIGGY